MPSSRFTFRLATWLVATWAANAALAAADAVKKSFDIPAEPAARALKAFSEQSGLEVLFASEAVKGVETHAVKGEMSARTAMDAILAGTDLIAIEDRSGAYSVRRGTESPNEPRVAAESSLRPADGTSSAPGARGSGSFSGTIVRPPGGPSIQGLTVALEGTGQSDTTDSYGRFSFGHLSAGVYAVAVSGRGYPSLRIGHIPVKARGNTQLAPETMPMRSSAEVAGMTEGDVLQMEKYEVLDRKPYTDENVDVVRTMNDVQPYYIFNGATIEQSGVVNVEDFLKTNLTMNTEAGTIAQGRSVYGGSSSISFNGLGTTQTLILINGRRLPAEILAGSPHQPPLNGIPLAAIDRVEVLPSSASAIYGGSAMAGVINVVLKKNYSGGALSLSYDNTFVSNTPVRTADLTDGISLAGGKVHVMITAHYSDDKPPSFADRPFVNNYFEQVIARNPALARYTLYDYATPNITSVSGNLTLKNGTALNSTVTHISPGAAPGSDLSASLLANAGTYNSALAPGTGGGGTVTNIEQGFREKLFRASVNWEVNSWLEAFAEFSTASYASSLPENPATSGTVPATVATNPFQQAVMVNFPIPQIGYLDVNNVIDVGSVGLNASFGENWRAEMDYTWSADKIFSTNNANYDTGAITAALAAGTINPFADTVAYPIAFAPYRLAVVEGFPATLNDLALRGSGSAFNLPGGSLQLVAGLEHRKEGVGDGYLSAFHPLTPSASTLADYFGTAQSTNSAYAEAIAPVFKSEGWVRKLELQLAGRFDSYSIGSGTSSASLTPNATPVVVTYSPVSTAPFHTTIDYHSANPTVGWKLDLAGGLALRTSYSTAFLPPTIAQLTPNPNPNVSLTTITDPVKGSSYAVQTISGGNSALTPQKAKDWDAGLIFEPKWPLLKGLRLNAEFYHIEESNVIGTLTAQQLVTLASNYPTRVIRDSTTGLITLVNNSALNLYKLVTEGWSTTAGWEHGTQWGTLRLGAMGTFIAHYGQQLAPGAPLLEYAGYANDGGPAKLKANASASWETGPWTAGWTVTYFGSYKQSGAPGSPLYADNPNAPLTTTYLLGQGGDHVPSQVYNDIFAAYRFPRRGHGDRGLRDYLLDSWRVSVGIKNLFNSAPPLDAFNVTTGTPYSFYGDPRLRHYWLSVTRDF